MKVSLLDLAPNGLRYWQVGGRGRCLEQYKFGARKMLENGDESHLPKHSGGVHALFGAL